MLLQEALQRGAVRNWMAFLRTAHEDERYETSKERDREVQAYSEPNASAILGQAQRGPNNDAMRREDHGPNGPQ